MIVRSVGVSTAKAYELKKIDENYFSSTDVSDL